MPLAKEGSGREESEGRRWKGVKRGRREEEFRDKKRQERKYSKKGASRKITMVNLSNALQGCKACKALW